ncbi:hypothetical protein [Alicyclobacillus sendaiensis]|uniref:Uncharacterized protein n=1 Tax=Alicyclobacillus sendaiensis PA2 TaxID=3029425 RepID=A0ABT6XX72_ALISE|nr:hypothetical protein [Alicyclobacillus sendaiensis]MDI9259382.1 hypothetical protein [Alicyclobacillus sendaiensis PA2]
MRMTPLDMARRSMQQTHAAVGRQPELRVLALEGAFPTEKGSPDKPYRR